MLHSVREPQHWFILGKRVVPLDIFYPILHGSQGEDQEGADHHLLHWDQLQGTQQEEPPQGQEGELESQEYYHLYFHCFHFCSFSSSFFLSLKLAGVVCLYSFFLLIKAINAV